MLCRGGVTFVNKMDQFIWGAQSVDNTPSDLNSKYSVTVSYTHLTLPTKRIV